MVIWTRCNGRAAFPGDLEYSRWPRPGGPFNGGGVPGHPIQLVASTPSVEESLSTCRVQATGWGERDRCRIFELYTDQGRPVGADVVPAPDDWVRIATGVTVDNGYVYCLGRLCLLPR